MRCFQVVNGVAVAALVAAGLFCGAIAAYAAEIPVVLVGDFENRTGDASYDSVGAGLGIHLSATLASTGRVRVITHESRRAAMAEARLAGAGFSGDTSAIFELTGANAALSGSFSIVADELLVGIELIDATSGEIKAVPPIYCEKTELKKMFERAGECVLEMLASPVIGENKGLPDEIEVVSAEISLDTLAIKGEVDAALFGADGRMRKDLSFEEKSRLIGLCESALEIEDGDAFLHSCLGALYGTLYGVGEPDLAVLHYEKAVELAPGDAAAYSNIGVELAQSGRLEEAIEKYETAISLNVRYAPAHYNLALAFLSRGDLESAEIELQNAIQFDRGYYSAYYYLGKTKRFLGKPAESADAYEKFFACAPETEAEKYEGLRRLIEQLKLEAESEVDADVIED